MAPENTLLEAATREEIDAKLQAAGWAIQDKKRLNLYESPGVAVREMDTDTGPADYMLFIDGKACGIIEAKREGANLGKVAEQSARYATSKTRDIQRIYSQLSSKELDEDAGEHSGYEVENYTNGKVNAGSDIYSIKTELTEQGNTIGAGSDIQKPYNIPMPVLEAA